MSDKYIFVGGKHDEVPSYLVDDATYALSDSELLADMSECGVGAPAGTYIMTAGIKKMKQFGLDGTTVSIVGG